MNWARRKRPVRSAASGAVRRLFVGSVYVAGLLAAGVVHLDRLYRHAFDASGGARAALLVVTVVAFAAGGVAGARLAPRVRAISGAHELRLAGLALAYAGLLHLAAAYAPNLALSTIARTLGAAAAGAAFVSMVQRISVAGRVRTALMLAYAAAAGTLIALCNPVVANALAVYGQRREWELVRPVTVPGMRATLLIAFFTGMAAAAECWAAARLVADAGDGDGRATTGPSRALARRHPESIFEVSGLDMSYGRLQVLFGVDLHVGQGETVALLGTNGAGKSSVLRATFGLHRPSAGTVWFEGNDITGLPAEHLVRGGMAQVPGGQGVFPSLTVRDNLRMAGYQFRERTRVREGIDLAVAAFPALERRLNNPAGVLSGGEQQMLALARAWILRPRLLAIDELTLGLAPTAIGELVAFVQLLRAEGISIIIVEQSVNVAFELCERAYFLERGTVRFEGRTADLMQRSDLLRSIFFEAHEQTNGSRPVRRRKVAS